MIVAGIDLGSATGKAVIMKDGDIVGSCVVAASARPLETANTVMAKALEEAGVPSVEHLENVVSTGYGRLKIPYASENVSEISCHAKGAHWMVPSIRTVIDIGGQDCKVVSVSERGAVLEFVMNDRCAAGTGRFFEGISELANQGEEPCTISNQCSVFAESEVVTLVNEGAEMRNIISGINISVAKRLRGMVRRVGAVEDVALSGGCSKNAGLAKAIGEVLALTLKKLPQDPQIAGAVGAALIAMEKLRAET